MKEIRYTLSYNNIQTYLADHHEQTAKHFSYFLGGKNNFLI